MTMPDVNAQGTVLGPDEVTLDNTDVDISELEFAPGFNRFYVGADAPTRNTSRNDTHWVGSLENRGLPYYCPVGWKRFSLKVAEGFGWEGCPICYHGTGGHNVAKIAKVGFKAHYLQHKDTFAYFTPSILYAAHPRYANIYKKGNVYTQVVLECRIKLERINMKGPETMAVKQQFTIDDNFPANQDLEFMVKPLRKDGHLGNYVLPSNGVVVSGIMVRSLLHDPADLPSSAWWFCWRAKNPRQFLRKKFYLPHDEFPNEADDEEDEVYGSN
eukprot:TRINITY_DN76056_c0_g1_i1.p1 TRINITY_DN76056_c0_g1~~TRINITY_DN76056_c0_g1_i1.p1  ORF type:complete len:271 (+),score=15.60 TRINITY_DN76056_c0_g1_i1:10-822(+)